MFQQYITFLKDESTLEKQTGSHTDTQSYKLWSLKCIIHKNSPTLTQ